MSESSWIIPVGDDRLHEGAALFLCATIYPEGGASALKLYEACGAFIARAVRESQGPEALVPELAELIKKVKTQQMNHQMNRAHRAILRLLITREHIFGGSMKPIKIPVASARPGVPTYLKVVISRASQREVLRTKRDPSAVQHDRLWADARRLSPENAPPMPEKFVGTMGPNPVPATHNIVMEDVDPSLNGLITEAARKLGITPRNFRRDYLNPARPVLHLAQALYQTGPRMRNDPEADMKDFVTHFNPQRLLLQPDWVRGAIQSANLTQNFWPGLQQMSPALRAIDAGRFIRLQPAAD